MYTRFFSLRERPFNLTPDPRYLFLSESHKDTLGQLLYAAKEEVGFVALIGEIGTGKTTVCRAFLNHIGRVPEKYVVALIFNPNLNDIELYKTLNRELGIEHRLSSKKGLQDILNLYLLNMKKKGKQVILIIDEAQNLSPEVLEQVRLLSNLETETQKLIQIILIGQPELHNMLESYSLRQLNQRISIRCNLKQLDYKDTVNYIRHRLSMAGGEHLDVFTKGAFRVIYKFSKGTPRRINIICDRAMLAAYTRNMKKITPAIVKQCVREVAGVPKGGRAFSWFARLTSAFGALAACMAILYSGPDWAGFMAEAAATINPKIMSARASITQIDAVSSPPPAESPQGSAGNDTPPSPPERDSQAPAAEAASPVEPAADGRVSDNSAVTGDTAVAEPAAPQESPTAEKQGLEQLAFSDDSRTMAVNSLLAVWGIEGGLRPAELQMKFAEIADSRGMKLLEGKMDMERLLAVNYPAILEVRDDRGRTGYIAVVGIWGKIYFGNKDGDLSVDKDWVMENWTGRTFIFWKDYKNLPQIIEKGEQGEKITWLQKSLVKLGYADFEPVGIYGKKTMMAVIRFQTANMLRGDGEVGDMTKMFLYRRLPEFAVPSLS